MSTNEHTPAPWTVQTLMPGSQFDLTEVFLGGDERADHFDPWVQVGGTNHEANARLIAAAPETKRQRDELLAALLGFKAVVDSLGWDAIGGKDSDLFLDFYPLATAAIDKAKREEA